jgi:phospholipid/cholesterol/gamma-HCH transport system ATP-binding protein
MQGDIDIDDRERRPVLEMANASLPAHGHAGSALRVDLTVCAGELILIQPGDDQHEQTLANAACGLLAPVSGEVCFLGRDWAVTSPDHANALRGRIGHAFQTGEWVPYLSLADNILLGELYHTRRPYTEVRDEAAALATRFGLPGLPLEPPDRFSTPDLRRANYVRALLGEPALILLESPAREVIVEILDPVINAIRAARDRDAAVIWFMLDTRLWFEASLPATRRYVAQGNVLVEETRRQ